MSKPLDNVPEDVEKLVRHKAKDHTEVGKYSKMTPEYESWLVESLANHPEQLTPSQKRLATMIHKYGSVAKALAHRDRTKMIMGGKYAGSAKGRKGLAAMPKEKAREIQRKGGHAVYPSLKKKQDEYLKKKRGETVNITLDD